MPKDKKQSVLRKKRRKKSLLGYFLLFVCVFIGSLSGISYLVNSYSPKVDVTIGNSESLTFTEPETDLEMKPIDERLKWIQMEDEMPSVALREDVNSEENDSNFTSQVEANKVANSDSKSKIEPPKPEMSEISQIDSSFRSELPKVVVPPPIPSLTKVYIGTFQSIDEAMAIQSKISSDIPDCQPFIKNKNGVYIVQLGSFSNKTVADDFIIKVKQLGYNPKTLFEN